MGSVHAVISLGLRDVRYNVGTPEQPRFLSFDFKGEEDKELCGFLGCVRGARAGGEALLGRLESNAGEGGRVRLPLVEPSVRYVLSAAGSLASIVWLTTDQPEDEPRRNSDTVTIARVVEDVLRRTVLARSSCAFRELRIGKDPHLDASAYRQVGAQLGAVVPYQRGDRVYTFLSGGIPAVGRAARQHALRLWGSDWVSCQVDEPNASRLLEGFCPGPEAVRVLQDRDNPMLEDTLLATVRALVEEHDYYAALRMWQASPVLRASAVAAEVEGLLRHAVARLNQDLEEAFRQAPALGPGLAPAGLAPLVRLRELCDAAEVHLRQGQLVPFVIKAAAFFENASRVLGWRVTGDEAWLTGSEVPATSVLKVNPKGRKINQSPTRRGTYEVTRELLRLAREKAATSRDGGLRRASEGLRALDPLYGLRNRVLHRLEPASEADLQPCGGTGQILANCRRVFAALGGDGSSRNGFDTVNAALQAGLRYTFER